ncbi:MAG TPA: LD-carboxypeptidase [Chitinophagaceae bacterium]|nr:LD-carboxypeptidase [Chitinophagaceae bacterium]
MNRKHFLASSASFMALSAFLPARGSSQVEDTVPSIPPYLKAGDTIGITSPAGYITLDEIRPSIALMESWGYQVRVGSTIGKRDFTFGGTDEERADDLQHMLDDRSVKAIMCARGGYGSVRIVDRLKWNMFSKQPKWVIGFSDITVLHSHINHNLGIATIHSKMCNSFPDDWAKADDPQKATIDSIRKALSGEKMRYEFASNPFNRAGSTMGALVGGNLKTLESLAGSSSNIVTKGKILFVEDTGEYLYSIDRMFWNLLRTGKLAQLAGLIIGGFKVKPSEDPAEEFGKNLQEIVLEKLKETDYPVCFDFPVGHQRNNFALKCGARHKLAVKADECSLMEII